MQTLLRDIVGSGEPADAIDDARDLVIDMTANNSVVEDIAVRLKKLSPLPRGE